MFTAFTQKSLLGLAVSLPAMGLLCSAAQAGKDNFRVYNDTTVSIEHLYVTASNENSWAKNVLADYSLPSGHNVQILFGNLSNEQCHYDIRAEFSDGIVVEDFHVNVCEDAAYTFFEG